MNELGYIESLKRRILIVDDEEINREILGHILEQNYEIAYADNGETAMSMLEDGGGRFSLILLDLLMPVMDGFTVLERIRGNERLTGIPVIVMTSEKPAEVRSIKLGADDFITKPYDMPEVILARCERIIQLYEDKSIIRSAEKDDLTGLYTREFFQEYVTRIDTYVGNRPMDAVVCNIEHFHMLNEMYGRKKGDRVLQATAAALFSLLGPEDIIGSRPDADYYYFYLPHRDSYEEIPELVQARLAERIGIPGIRIRMGIYQTVNKTRPAEHRFDHAKLACDRIRGDYTRQILVYSREMNERDLYEERLIHDIDAAIANRDLIVYYQPKYNIRGEEPQLCSAEALIRWRHPELGMISPGDFIPLFESNGLIQKLDHYVWEEAAAQIGRWKKELGRAVPVSVNMSRVDIYDPELEQRFLGLLQENDLTPADLMLEVTESAYADDAQGLIDVVNRLREQGFRIEMDDFGTGYSSLNMITTIPIDVLKMDMIFIRNMNRDEKSLRLVELVLEIAEFLKVPVVAEGVEDKAQVEQLRKMGCDIIQGYYFSKPVPPEEFEAFIRKG